MEMVMAATVRCQCALYEMGENHILEPTLRVNYADNDGGMMEET